MWHSCLAFGALVAPSVQGHWLPPLQELWPHQNLFSSLLHLVTKRPLWPVFPIASPTQALRVPPCLGSFSVVQCTGHIEGPLGGVLLCGSACLAFMSGIWWASLSIVQLPMLACGGREAMVMALSPTRDSAVWPCFHSCPTFLHRHFPPQSPPSHPLNPSLRSQQQPSPRDCSTIPKFQLPATAPSRVCMAAARTVWFSFHLGCHRSAVSLSALNVSPLTQSTAPMWGSDPCFSSLTHRGQGQSY